MSTNFETLERHQPRRRSTRSEPLYALCLNHENRAAAMASTTSNEIAPLNAKEKVGRG